MTTRLPRLPGTPPAEHYPMIGEAQAPDGTWHLIAGPGLARDVIATVQVYRRDQGHLEPETRVGLASGEQLAHWRAGQ